MQQVCAPVGHLHVSAHGFIANNRQCLECWVVPMLWHVLPSARSIFIWLTEIQFITIQHNSIIISSMVHRNLNVPTGKPDELLWLVIIPVVRCLKKWLQVRLFVGYPKMTNMKWCNWVRIKQTRVILIKMIKAATSFNRAIKQLLIDSEVWF